MTQISVERKHSLGPDAARGRAEALDARVTEELIARLGSGTTVASVVNDEPGLWIGFAIESDNWRARIEFYGESK